MLVHKVTVELVHQHIAKSCKSEIRLNKEIVYRLMVAEKGRIPGKTAEQHKKRRETRRGVEVRKVDTRNNKHCSSGTFPSKSMYKII